MNQPRKKLWPKLLMALLILIGIAATLLWTLPARFIFDRYGAQLQPLRLQGIEGTLWQGKAAMASYAARPLGPVQWQLKPLSLLRGAAQGTLTMQGQELEATTSFQAFGRRVELSHAKARYPASMMAAALDIPSLNLLGQVDVHMQDVVIENGMIRSVIGELIWNDVGVSGAAEARLGKLIVQFAPRTDGRVEGLVRDDGGPMEAQGRVFLDGLKFNAEVTLHARPGQDQIREALLYIGERTLDGGSVLRVEGVISPLY